MGDAKPVVIVRLRKGYMKRGYLDPFTQPDVRKNVLAALGQAARDGRLEKRDRGIYALPAAKS